MGFAASQNEVEGPMCQRAASESADMEGVGQGKCCERRICIVDGQQTVDHMGTADSISLERRPTGKRSKSDISSKALLTMVVAQGYRCALSGRILTPDSASMDHKRPFAKGGTHELSNVWIVDWRVNRAKGAMEPDEFVRMCRDVVVWQDRTASAGGECREQTPH